MTTEVRYIMFTQGEARNAIVTYVLKEGHASTPDDIMAMSIAGGIHEALSVTVQVRRAVANRTIIISSARLVGALLLYCKENRIPIPRRAQKAVEPLTDGGLTLVVTTDLIQKQPAIAHNHITYTGIASYAQETSQAKQELAAAVERTEVVKAMVARANARADAAEEAAAEAVARLTVITPVPGLIGQLGRWLLRQRRDVSPQRPRS